MFRDLLYFDQIRGPHSTGVASVGTTGECLVYKRALAASDFVQLNGFNARASHATTCLIGHNRYATMGAKDDNNAHPFQHGDVTLVHNGTLTTKTVHKAKGEFPTDSESIAYALTEEGTTEEVLERLEGAYALVWHDASDNTLHFARNAERTLYIGLMGGDLVWSSLKGALQLAAEHHKVNLTDVELLPTGEHTIYDLDALASGGTVIEFTPKKPRIRTGTRTTTTKSGGFRSRIGELLTGYLFQVNATGFFRAATYGGETLEGVCPTNSIAKFQRALEDGDQIRGRVRSSTSRWLHGEHKMVHNLQSGELSVLGTAEVATIDTCVICKKNITFNEVAEEHQGVHYHTRCLDAKQKVM